MSPLKALQWGAVIYAYFAVFCYIYARTIIAIKDKNSCKCNPICKCNLMKKDEDEHGAP